MEVLRSRMPIEKGGRPLTHDCKKIDGAFSSGNSRNPCRQNVKDTPLPTSGNLGRAPMEAGVMPFTGGSC